MSAGISTFTGLIDANDDVDVAKTLTVQQRLNVGTSGTVISADTGTEKIGFFNSEPSTKFQFNILDQQSIYFDEQGRIGIGTTAGGKPTINDANNGPLKLDVRGSIAIDRNIYDSAGATGENNFFLSRDENGIRWVNIVPQDPVGIFLQDEGVFVPTVGIAQSFSTLNFVQTNSGGIGTDTLIPTAANPSSATGLSTIFTQDLWGYTNSEDIYRMSLVGINNNNPEKQLDIDGTLRATGIVQFTNNTSSTSKTTGALVVGGGLGLNENLIMGGSFDVGGTGKINSGDNSSSSTTGAFSCYWWCWHRR